MPHKPDWTGWYCFVFHSRSPNAKVHKCRPDGLPACGARVGTDALERVRDVDSSCCEPCSRCFPDWIETA